MTALNRIRHKLDDAREKRGTLGDTHGSNDNNLGDLVDNYNNINPDDDMIGALGNMNNQLNPIDSTIKDTNKDAADLLAALGDLDTELVSFDTDARKGKLNDAKSHLEEALHELEDIEKRLRELESGVKETSEDVNAKQAAEESPDAKLAEVADKLGVLSDDTADMRARKDDAVKSIQGLMAEIDSYNGGNIEDLLEKAKQLSEQTTDVKKDVETGHKRLEELRKAFADALARLELEKRHKAMKAEREKKRL